MEEKKNEILISIKEGTVFTLRMKDECLVKAMNEFINKRKWLGVYLSTLQTAENVKKMLEKNGINSENIFFIDMFGGEEKENVFSLKDPSDLTELSVVITEVMEDENVKFIIIGGLSGLEVHTTPSTIKKFLHSLIAYIKKLKKVIIIFYTGKESDEVMQFLIQISDIFIDQTCNFRILKE